MAEQHSGSKELEVFDLMVVGAGVNGAGIARDAAGRGLKVALCEQGDIAEGTSSRSGKLVHGGLRYLEYYEFRLVREALKEREVLLENAPHIIWPMRFVLPHDTSLRPAWMIRAGLFLYDHLGGLKRLPKSRSLNLRRDPEGQALKESYRKGFEYSDCWVEDARLVLLNVRDAVDRGARFMARTRCTGARRENGRWIVELKDLLSGEQMTVGARALVNAAGPWVDRMLGSTSAGDGRQHVRLVKGSHIVLPKFYDGDQAYLLQNTDRRVIFVNPYEENYLLVGTTDIPYEGDLSRVEADSSEIDYLCDALNRYFRTTVSASDVVWSFSGVRPLYDDNNANPSAVTRDYVFDLSDDGRGGAVLLSIFGGKITTYRRMAEHALQRLAEFLPGMGESWTESAALPGGDIDNADFDGFVARLAKEYPWLPEAVLRHYAHCYGTRIRVMLDGAQGIGDLGRHFGAGFYEREARYAVSREWARTADDILWRRTKWGLHLSEAQRDAFRQWMADEIPAPGAELV